MYKILVEIEDRRISGVASRRKVWSATSHLRRFTLGSNPGGFSIADHGRRFSDRTNFVELPPERREAPRRITGERRK